MNYLFDLIERTFGIVYYLDFDERKTLQKDISIENLIQIGIKYEKKIGNKPLIINQQLDCYGFLKRALEENYPFSKRAQDYLGLLIDRSGISQPQKLTIGIQAAAQVLWFYKKDKIPFIRSMREEIWNNQSLINLLKLRKIHNERVVENAIRLVNPKLKGKKRKDNPYSQVVLIPKIFLESSCQINFLKLRFAVMILSKILLDFGLSQEEIISSKIIHAYRKPLRFYPRFFIDGWIIEALSKSGSIYTF